MKKIPKIIHQIWSDKYEALPEYLSALCETWKEKHPDWEYILWDEQMMHDFVQSEYPQLYAIFQALPFDMQRWDGIRFLILKKHGGVHIDIDYECLENIEPLLEGRTCCIALEPDKHCKMYKVNNFINSALMACIPEHPFTIKLANRVFREETLEYDTRNRPGCIMYTTGPLMISNFYDTLSQEEKNDIYLMPAKYVTPFDMFQIRQVKAGIENEELETCLEEAYAVHYFTNLWVPIE